MIPLYTAEEMRAIENEAITSQRVTGLELQERAARGAAVCLPHGVVVEVLAGPGNNGGDALAVARMLRNLGHRVRVWTLSRNPVWHGDAGVQAERWTSGGGSFVFTENPSVALDGWATHWIVDGLFGLGSSRAMSGLAAAWVEALSCHRVGGILALDLPSGLDPSAAEPFGPVAPATITACFGFPKVCHGLEPSRSLCGTLDVVDLGVELLAETVSPSHGLVDYPWLPSIPWDVHKRGRGHVGIRAGTLGMSGAAVLAALGALRVGAGLVTVLTDSEVRMEVACQIPEAMVRPWEGTVPEGIDVLLVGPGGVHEIPEWSGPMVVDASALKEGEGSRWMQRPETVITPHAGEFSRIFGLPKPMTVNDRIAQVRKVATGPGVVLLKGPQSITAGGGTDELWFNDTGHPGLATGGTGDFLAGMVAGLVGQRDRLPEGCRTLRHAVASAVWLHGRCADRIGQGPLLPRDLAAELPMVLRGLYA